MIAAKRIYRIYDTDRLTNVRRKRNTAVTNGDIWTPVPPDVGVRLQDLCEVLGWDNKRLAKDGGVSIGQASRWLNGKQVPMRKALNLIISRNKLPREIFEVGGRMPSAVNLSLTGQGQPTTGEMAPNTSPELQALAEEAGRGLARLIVDGVVRVGAAVAEPFKGSWKEIVQMLMQHPDFQKGLESETNERTARLDRLVERMRDSDAGGGAETKEDGP